MRAPRSLPRPLAASLQSTRRQSLRVPADHRRIRRFGQAGHAAGLQPHKSGTISTSSRSLRASSTTHRVVSPLRGAANITSSINSLRAVLAKSVTRPTTPLPSGPSSSRNPQTIRLVAGCCSTYEATWRATLPDPTMSTFRESPRSRAERPRSSPYHRDTDKVPNDSKPATQNITLATHVIPCRLAARLGRSSPTAPPFPERKPRAQI